MSYGKKHDSHSDRKEVIIKADKVIIKTDKVIIKTDKVIIKTDKVIIKEDDKKDHKRRCCY